MRKPACVKCGQSLEKGYVLDSAHSSLQQKRWVEGEPTPGGFWHAGGLKLQKGARIIPVITWRCTGCGYLESYAKPER